jgi:hypothetical protein
MGFTMPALRRAFEGQPLSLTMPTTDGQVGLWRGIKHVAPLLMCAALCWPAHAYTSEFRVLKADTELIGGVYRLNAVVNYDLTKPVQKALLNGVDLVFEMQIEVLRDRTWWWDADIANLNQSYRLSYHALSRQFVVENLNTSVQQTFSDLASALRHQGTVRELPLIDAALLNHNQTYTASLRARLSLSELPLPIRVRAHVSGEWRLSSGWYTWELS